MNRAREQRGREQKEKDPKLRRNARAKEEDMEIQRIEQELTRREQALANWAPKTELGKAVKAGKINSIDEIFEKGMRIMEPEIVDTFLKLEEDVVEVEKTTRVVLSGRKFSYRAAVLVGDKNGHIGLGTAKDVDRFPAITKARRYAKLNLIKINRGSGSWEEQPTEDKHSIPFKVTGKSGSVKVTIIPAPKGTGLAVGKNIRAVFVLAGIQNIWSKASGRSSVKLNFTQAAMDALAKLSQIKSTKDLEKKLSK